MDLLGFLSLCCFDQVSHIQSELDLELVELGC